MKNKNLSTIILILIMLICAFTSLQSMQPVKADFGNRYRVNARLDAIHMIDDGDAFWDGYISLDLYICGIYGISYYDSSSLQISSGNYHDFGSIWQNVDFTHPTTSGLEYISSQTDDTLSIHVNVRDHGVLGDRNDDRGWVSYINSDPSIGSLQNGWIMANTGNFRIYLIITVSDISAPITHETQTTPIYYMIGNTDVITITTKIEDFSGITSVDLSYSIDFEDSVTTVSMEYLNTTGDYLFYSKSIGAFPYGTQIHYNISLLDNQGNSMLVIYSPLGVGIPLKQAEIVDFSNAYLFNGTMVNYQYDYYNFSLAQTSAVNISLNWLSDAQFWISLCDSNGQFIQSDFSYDTRFPLHELFTVPSLAAGDYYVMIRQTNDIGLKSPYEILFKKISGSLAPVISDLQYSTTVMSSDENLKVEFNVTDDIFVDDVEFTYSLDNGNTWNEISSIDGWYQSPYVFIGNLESQFRYIPLIKNEIVYINCSWDYEASSNNMDFYLSRVGTTESNASYLTCVAGDSLACDDPSPELATFQVCESGVHLLALLNSGGLDPQTGTISFLSSHLSVIIPGNPFPQDGIPIKFKIRATDIDGNVNELIQDIPVIDDIAPVIDIVSLEDQEKYNSLTLNLAYKTTDDNVVWYLDGVNQGSITNNTLITLTDGERNVTIVATDFGGLTASDTVIIYVDVTNPIVTINKPLNNSLINVNSFSLEYQVSDLNIIAGDLENYVIVYLNGESRGYMESGSVLSSIQQGFYNLTVIAQDSYGNIGKDTVFFTIDTDSPNIEILSPDAGIGSDQDILIQYTYNEEGLVAVFVNGEYYSSIVNNSLVTFPDGDYNLTITVTDDAGNVGKATVLFTIDTTPATVAILSPLLNYYNVDELPITWQKEDGTILTVYIDGIETIVINNTIWTFSEGLHNITLVVVDDAGNSNSATVLFTIDLTLPDISIISPEVSEYSTDSIIFTFTVNEQLSSITAILDGIELPELSNNTWLTGLTEGTHNLTIIAVDLAGNEVLKTVMFSIDTILPNIEIINPTEGYFNYQNIAVSCSYETGALITVYVDGIVFPSFNNNSLIYFSEGSHNITIVAQDAVGNLNSTFVIFTVDVTNPEITILSPMAIEYDTESNILSYTVNEEIAGLQVYLYLDGVELIDAVNNSALTGLTEGTHNLTIIVVDLAGNEVLSTIIFSIEFPTITTTTSITSESSSETSDSNQDKDTSTSSDAPGFAVITFLFGLSFIVLYSKRLKRK